MLPRAFHAIWIDTPIPDHILECLQSWKKVYPHWDHRLWREKDIDSLDLSNRSIYDQAATLVPGDAVSQLRADVARYEILYRFGGFYHDADTIALRSMENLLNEVEAFAAAEDMHHIGNTYLACTPGHPVMAELMSKLQRNVRVHVGRRPNWLSGPRYLTPIWRKHECYVAPREQFFPYSYTDVRKGTVPTIIPDHVYCVHTWDHTRRVLESR